MAKNLICMGAKFQQCLACGYGEIVVNLAHEAVYEFVVLSDRQIWWILEPLKELWDSGMNLSTKSRYGIQIFISFVQHSNESIAQALRTTDLKYFTYRLFLRILTYLNSLVRQSIPFSSSRCVADQKAVFCFFSFAHDASPGLGRWASRLGSRLALGWR